jgi:hypothetical protein
MFETTIILLKDISRTLTQKIYTSPILYLFFSSMVFFSLVMFAFLTLFMMHTDTTISALDVYYGLFSIFFIKTTADIHKYFISSSSLCYAFSTEISHKKTIRHICYAILLLNSALWFSFSGLYLVVLHLLGVSVFYPFEYVLFCIGVFSAIIMGCTVSIHFFSAYQYRLLPTILLVIFFWYAQSMLFLFFVFPLVLVHLFWSIYHGMDSYLYFKRKQRNKEKNQAKIRTCRLSIFYKEITILWRERLLISFIVTAILTAVFSGYLAVYGADILIPESIIEYAGDFLPNMFVFLGVYIVVIYTAIFPSLNLFLNEEKTLWIYKNLPISSEDVIKGKILSLSLCFLASLPFLAYIVVFIGLDDIVFIVWFFVFSFIAAVGIAIGFGAKYVGKKSDILLLYSVSIILFVVLAGFGNIGLFILKISRFGFFYLVLLLFLDICFLFGSMKLSARIMRLN